MKQNQTRIKQPTRIKSLVMTLLLLLYCSYSLQGQVTVGAGTAPQNYSVLEVVSNGQGGLRLPHLTTDQRDALKDGASGPAFSKDPNRTTPFLYEGLTIYNTSTRCMEYYNAERWISMCDGTSQMKISPQPCNNVPADGKGCDSEFTVTDPDCPNGPFAFMVIVGGDYANLDNANEADGSFKVSFQANNSINQRSAIVRVTSNCTGLYKDFLFSQLGQSCNPTLSEAPAITSNPSGNNISFCAGGAIYLSIPANTPNLDEVIWTRNNIEIARGVNNIAVTQAGVYDVWMGLIGCGQKPGNTVTVTKDGTGAPDKVAIVVSGNNGLVCGAEETTKLVATKPATGTVRWFKDGVLQTVTSPDNEVDAGVGEWFAAVSDGSCWSKPSDAVTVSVDPNSGAALTMPEIQKPASFCAGSSVQLYVKDPSYNPAYTYTWYENNTQLGVGRYLMYNVPSDASSVVLRCRATLSGSCAAEALNTESITAGTIPYRPVITGNPVLCSGSATLNVVPVNAGTYTYAWYKDGQLIGTSQSLTVTTGGDYYATVIEAGGCPSPQAYIKVSNTSSAMPTVTLNRSTENPNENDVVTYSASINFNPATNYTWTITNATLQSGAGSNEPFAVVKFDQLGAASVKVEVSNTCGTGIAIHDIANVQAACAKVSNVSPSTNSTHNTVTEQGVTLGTVSATFESGSPAAYYQWYSNTSNTNTGGTAISGANGNSYVANEATAGTYYYYCEVSNAGCPTVSPKASGVYTVIVSPNPANLSVGTGSLIGNTCFDIAYSNNNENGCGLLNYRLAQKADFTLTNEQDMDAGTLIYPYSGTQVYTFKPTGDVSNVRFVVIDPSGKVIQSYTPNEDYSDTYIASPCKLTVKYKASLNEDAKGRTAINALSADIYAVFNDKADGSGIDKAVKLTVRVQDCACCGMDGIPYKQKIGKNSYLTHYYGDQNGNLRCWMVENIKETSSKYTQYKTPTVTKSLGERGFYYSSPNFTSACPSGSGWRTPSSSEMNYLISYLNLSTTVDASRSFWRSNAAAGYYPWEYYTRWDVEHAFGTSNSSVFVGSYDRGWTSRPNVPAVESGNGWRVAASIRCVMR